MKIAFYRQKVWFFLNTPLLLDRQNNELLAVVKICQQTEHESLLNLNLMGKVTLPKNALFYLIITILCGGYSYGQSQTFSSTTTFTVPPGVTSIMVQAWGGGGHGSTMSSAFAGGGGGGGAFASMTVSVVPGHSYIVNVGAGSTSSSPGGDSWFKTSSTVLAKGGNSANNNDSSGGSGGSAFASIGTIRSG